MSAEVKTEADSQNVLSLHEELIIKDEDPQENVEIITAATVGRNLSGKASNSRRFRADSRMTGPTKKQKVTLPTTELCVLCMRCIILPCRLYSVADDSDLIRSVTGINVSNYPVPSISCEACYECLSNIKKFIQKVRSAKSFFTDCLKYRNKLKHAKVTEKNADSSSALETHEVDMQETRVDQNSPESPAAESAANTERDTSLPSRFNADVNLMQQKLFAADSKQIEEAKQQKLVRAQTKINKENLDVSMKTSNVRCEMCKKLFERGTLKQHMKTHTRRIVLRRPRPELCQVCETVCPSLNNLKNHMKTHGPVKVECKICKKQIHSTYIHIHIHRHENPDEKYVCSVCGKSLTTLFGLQTHKVTHEEKQHRCSVCQASFHHDKYLERHMRTHSGEKPFACAYCDRKFSILWNKKQHERLHTNEKPYKCQVCSAAFRHNVVLKQHLSSTHSANEIRQSVVSSDLENEKSKEISTNKTM